MGTPPHGHRTPNDRVSTEGGQLQQNRMDSADLPLADFNPMKKLDDPPPWFGMFERYDLERTRQLVAGIRVVEPDFGRDLAKIASLHYGLPLAMINAEYALEARVAQRSADIRKAQTSE